MLTSPHNYGSDFKKKVAESLVKSSLSNKLKQPVLSRRSLNPPAGATTSKNEAAKRIEERILQEY